MLVQDAFHQFLHVFDPLTKDQQYFQTLSAKFTITGAANNGSGLIRITAAGHGLKDLDRVYIGSVNGTVEANNSLSNPNWQITWVSASTFDLIGSTFTNAFTSSPNAFGVGALVGTVHGDKLPKERLLQAYNQARVAMIGEMRNEVGDNTDEISKRLGGQSIVAAIIWTRAGNKATAPRPAGLIKFYSMVSPSGKELVLRSQNDLQKVIRGDSVYAQSATTVYIFDEGVYFVHHGNYVSTTSAVNITGATNATPIVITAPGQELSDGDFVTIASVGGNTAANGEWQVDNVDGVGDTFDLVGSVGNGAYTTGGTVTKLYRLSYLGITDWTFTDVIAGTAEETIRPEFIPRLIQLAAKIARSYGSGTSVEAA